MDSKNKFIASYTDSAVLAFHLLKLFPSCKIKQFGLFEAGVYCDINLGQDFHPEHITELQQLLSSYQSSYLQEVEMLRVNAIEMLHYKKQSYLESYLKKQTDQIALLARYEEQYLPIEFSLSPRVSAQPIAIYDVVELEEESCYRFKGILAKDKQALKQFIRAQSILNDNHHLYWGKLKGLFNSEYIWLEKGIEFQDRLKNYLSYLLQSTSFQKIHLPLLKQVFPQKDPLQEISYQKLASYIYQNQDSNKVWGFFERTSDYSVDSRLHYQSLIQKDLSFSLETEDSSKSALTEALDIILKLTKLLKVDINCLINYASQFSSTFSDQKIKMTNYIQNLCLEKGIDCHIEKNSQQARDSITCLFTLKDNYYRTFPGSEIKIFFTKNRGYNPLFMNKKSKYAFSLLIVRSFFGSIERFIALLLENMRGELPFWLSPTQVCLLPMHKRHETAARDLQTKLVSLGYRVEINSSNDSLKNRIVKSQNQKNPFTVVVGDDKEKVDVIDLRKKAGKSNWILVEDLITRLKELALNCEDK